VRLQELSDHVLGPIISAARGLEEDAADVAPGHEVLAALAATGMSYKEIARRLNRSFSTIDHQLRSVRSKLGARSAGRLVRKLAPDAPPFDPADR